MAYWKKKGLAFRWPAALPVFTTAITIMKCPWWCVAERAVIKKHSRLEQLSTWEKWPNMNEQVCKNIFDISINTQQAQRCANHATSECIWAQWNVALPIIRCSRVLLLLNSILHSSHITTGRQDIARGVVNNRHWLVTQMIYTKVAVIQKSTCKRTLAAHKWIHLTLSSWRWKILMSL